MTDETQAQDSASTPTEAVTPALTPLPYDWETNRPPFILSFVDTDDPNGGFVLGWDTCGLCNKHIRICRCVHGPAQPDYVKRWRSDPDDKPSLTTLTKAIVVADPAEVERAVEETLEPATTGRKRRADAGVKRGPRKDPNATAESVTEAAGDLADAMSKENG